ncbi:hypothetical protein JHK86_045960 [Glycine max]|nr:hypothetical protein JHK86_045960 [Glycine max]
MRKKLLLATTKGLSFRSNRNFTSKSNHLFYEVCYSADPSKFQQRGWSHAASVPSEEPRAPKAQKRVPRHQRRAMVESFVNKYRAENAGKFPKISDTQKQVGGSYYVIREIVLELEYESKMNSSNSVDKFFVGKKFDESKLLTTESVNVPSGNIEIAKESPVKDDSQSVVLDDKESVNTGYEHLEEKREPQTSYLERRLPDKLEIMSTPSNHCIAPESNIVEKFSKEPYPSSLDMPNDIKSEEAVSTYSDSFAPEHSQEEREHSPLFSENDGTGYDKAQGREYDFVRVEDHKKVEEKCIKKADCEIREQPDLEDLSRELLHSSLKVPNDVKSKEAVTNSSDSATQERHPLKEEIDQFSAPFIEKSVSSCSEGQTHDSKFVDMEKHSAFEKGNARKDQDTVDGLKHKIGQSHRSLELDESKMDSSNKRETSVAVGAQKSTLWGNMKSFATGILNIWKKS